MHFDRPKTTFREGNVFTGVCQSVHSGGESGSTFPPYPPTTVIPGTIPPGPYPQGPYPAGLYPLGTVPLETIPTPPGTTKAGGTHPTGMLPCCLSSPQVVLRVKRDHDLFVHKQLQGTIRFGC